jgi:hypothetical protein
VNGQVATGQGVGKKTPGCSWVRVEQAAVGAPLVRAAASRKHSDTRTRAAMQKDILRVKSLLNAIACIK